jgi:hypothetical protein
VPQFKLNKFSNMAFLQGIDIKDRFVPFLDPYKTYFEKRGVDLATLKNDHASAKALHEVFTNADERMPAELLRDLYMLDELADENGHERILSQAQWESIPINGAGSTLSAGDFVLQIHKDHPGIIRHCHVWLQQVSKKSFKEYQGRTPQSFTLAEARQKAPQAASILAPWFDVRGHGRWCDVLPHEDGDDICFQILRGKLYKTEGSLDHSMQPSRVNYRPQKLDSVVFDTSTCVLKIAARSKAEKDKYREVFGQVFFNDPDHFPEADLYTLEPLRKMAGPLACPPGVSEARLGEVHVAFDDEHGNKQILIGSDVLAAIAQNIFPKIETGTITSATFKVKYASGRRARNLEIRVPNQAIYNRTKDSDISVDFLMVNGFIKTGGKRDEPTG